MTNASHPLSLRQILFADAVTCTAMGTLLVLAPGTIAELTRVPEALLFYAGASLFPVAIFMAIVASRPAANRTAIWIIIAGNGLWVAGSLALALGLIAPNALGVTFILAQALAVAVLAWLEHAALRAEDRQTRHVA